jgi:hypothetical protein
MPICRLEAQSGPLGLSRLNFLPIIWPKVLDTTYAASASCFRAAVARFVPDITYVSREVFRANRLNLTMSQSMLCLISLRKA